MVSEEQQEDDAKRELLRLDDLLDEPVLLIGGLAVQRYIQERRSKDIDIVCDLATQKRLLERAYSDPRFEKSEDQGDMRPNYVILDTISGSTIYLGSKILERPPYPFINYDVLMEDALPYSYSGVTTKYIKIPSAYSLAFTKLVSFISRRSSIKGIIDLEDFAKLTNDKTFSLNRFISLVDRLKARDHIREFFDKNDLNSEEKKVIRIASPIRFHEILPVQIFSSSDISSSSQDNERKLIRAVRAISTSPIARELGPLLEQIEKSQFSKGVIRRSWNVQIDVDIKDIENGVIYENISWDCELLNVHNFPLEYEYELIHSDDQNAGKLTGLFVDLPDGTREAVPLHAHIETRGTHYQRNIAKIILEPNKTYYSTLFYRNLWYINREIPMFTNATTSKIPCLYAKFLFRLPPGFRVSLLKSGVQTPIIVENTYDFSISSPLLAEQKIEWLVEEIKNDQ